jgi:type I restriction enzyme M protein
MSFATVNRWEGGSSKPQKAARDVIAALAQELDDDVTKSAMLNPWCRPRLPFRFRRRQAK